MAAVRTLGRRFLLWCANEHNDFRIHEISSLVKLFDIDMKWVEQNSLKPYIVVDVPSESDVKKIMSRSMLIRSAYELWGRASSHEDLHNQIRNLPSAFLKPFCSPKRSFSIRVETYCKTLSSKEKLDKIEMFDYLPVEGPVKLDGPDVPLFLLEFYGTNPNDAPEAPLDVFFGRLICNGQRDKIAKLSLKNRKFIGNTSMDAQLSLIMANQALVKPGSLVYDPFVGTGGLLVAAAQFGGYVWGVDIDYLLIHGKGNWSETAAIFQLHLPAKPSRFTQIKRDDDESVASNLSQYNLGSQYMDVIVGDSSLPFWRKRVWFDSIITDPPYGIRESNEKIGTKRSNRNIKEEHLKQHIPSKIHYNMRDMYRDLTNFAADHLKVGGRLVFWLPVFLEDYTEESIPTHPCFELIANSEQPLAKHSSRHLITLAKIREPTEEDEMKANVSCLTARFSKQYFKAAAENRLSHQNRPDSS